MGLGNQAQTGVRFLHTSTYNLFILCGWEQIFENLRNDCGKFDENETNENFSFKSGRHNRIDEVPSKVRLPGKRKNKKQALKARYISTLAIGLETILEVFCLGRRRFK